MRFVAQYQRSISSGFPVVSIDEKPVKERAEPLMAATMTNTPSKSRKMVDHHLSAAVGPSLSEVAAEVE